jgi:hypothetical protein
MALVVLFEQFGINELVDPEIDDALRSDPEKAHHFSKRRHSPVFPEEGGNGFLDGLDGAFFFHGCPI